MVLVDQQFFYVVVYFEEIKLFGICVGMCVQVCLMSGDQLIDGMVESISSGIIDCNLMLDGQLLVNVELIFNWVCLVQCILVCICFDQVLVDVYLSVGMIVSVIVQGD